MRLLLLAFMVCAFVIGAAYLSTHPGVDLSSLLAEVGR